MSTATSRSSATSRETSRTSSSSCFARRASAPPLKTYSLSSLAIGFGAAASASFSTSDRWCAVFQPPYHPRDSGINHRSMRPDIDTILAIMIDLPIDLVDLIRHRPGSLANCAAARNIYGGAEIMGLDAKG
ncbi:hypothetical protein E2562_002122 [Oryza meyeriana var. granulata]|uniref:Uncharacterized protein n=1 Tax=Oryza meyeriana var. granulata TaxID=110450 RepID=A0A6G1EFZ6_9ORYZ|nr:hypothetical protein E2562_002122 [Oryza meyeriana var. granulata]